VIFDIEAPGTIRLDGVNIVLPSGMAFAEGGRGPEPDGAGVVPE